MNQSPKSYIHFLFSLTVFLPGICIYAQHEQHGPLESIYSNMNYRCIGPFRGGRSAAVAGVPGKPMLYYMGAAGGGVWKTEDGGSNWENVSDGFFWRFNWIDSRCLE
ncbi:hypothetical protein OAE37_00300 [Pirellulaceae bacterium]|nr:hypothetical protein [Pirellulaceae bacterium]